MNTLSKILTFFNGQEKRKLFAIMSCIAVMGIVEMVGIAAILPFMAVVASPEVIQTNVYLAKVYGWLGFSQPKYFMLFLGMTVFTFLVIGNAFSAMTCWLMTRFCYRQGKKISCELLQKYLKQPYIFFLNRNSSDLTKNILAEVDRLIIGIFINVLQSFAKIVMITCICTLLVLVDPLLAMIVMVVLGGAYVAVYGLIRQKLIAAGKLSSQVNTTRYQLITEVMSTIKELKILGREQKFTDEYSDAATQYANAETLSQLSPLVTRYIIEAIALGGMVLIALYLITTQEDINKFMPLLGLYAIAGYRLMPAMQQVFSGFSLLKYHLSALDILHREMQLPEKKELMGQRAVMALKNELCIDNIDYAYPQASKVALKQVSLNIRRHSTVGIVGASGAGKTTLVDVILGLLEPSKGRLCVDGTVIHAHNVRDWQHNIGYVPQNICLIDASIAQNIALGVKSEDIDQRALIEAATMANLHEFICQELAEGYDTFIGERGVRLSGGQRQRIGIARALYHNPELLIFDEATSALDGMTEKVIMEAIKRLAHKKTIILIAHRLNTVKDCDVIYVFNQGEVVGKGTYQELFDSNQTFQFLANAYVGT
jgi:ABC-type multidrug transport system fused ATPase/permease subunit